MMGAGSASQAAVSMRQVDDAGSIANIEITDTGPCAPNPTLYIQSEPGGVERLSRLLFVKPNHM